MSSDSHWYESILDEFIQSKGSTWSIGEMLGEGGSAAVWRLISPDRDYALKIYKPQFFTGDNEQVERQRIGLQSALCGHSCPDLIQMHEVDFVGGSAYILMDFVPWPSMDVVVGAIPAARFPSLIACVARAAKWLHDQGYVHRDIKPANILVSPNYDRAILVDLGVMRFADAMDGDLTDHGFRRPFVATAQYSSPEYLFRTVEPGPNLWKGLTYYQLGAVLHDLLVRAQLFDREVKTFNKYILAMAVMNVVPSFALAERDPRLIALASRCLDKRLESRLSNVDWQDFLDFEEFDADRARKKLLLKSAQLKVVNRGARLAEELSFQETKHANDVESALRRICAEEGYPRATWRKDGSSVQLSIELPERREGLTFICKVVSRVHSIESGVELSMVAGLFSSAGGPMEDVAERRLMHIPLDEVASAADLLRDLLSDELLRSFYKADQIADGVGRSDLPIDLNA